MSAPVTAVNEESGASVRRGLRFRLALTHLAIAVLANWLRRRRHGCGDRRPVDEHLCRGLGTREHIQNGTPGNGMVDM